MHAEVVDAVEVDVGAVRSRLMVMYARGWGVPLELGGLMDRVVSVFYFLRLNGSSSHRCPFDPTTRSLSCLSLSYLLSLFRLCMRSHAPRLKKYK